MVWCGEKSETGGMRTREGGETVGEAFDARDGVESHSFCSLFVLCYSFYGCLDDRGRRGAALVFFSAAR